MKCFYCSKEIIDGTGLMFVYKTGNIKYFCSHKCFTNNNRHIKINKKIIIRNKNQ